MNNSRRYATSKIYSGGAAIEFGDTGYLALHRFEADAFTVLAIRHPKEAGC
jgi:hypothetical protein